MTLQVMHNGYSDPDNIVFEDITILGFPDPPVSVTVTHVGSDGVNNATVLPNSNFQHNLEKEVWWQTFINKHLSKHRVILTYQHL